MRGGVAGWVSLKTMVSLKVCIFGRSRVGTWLGYFEVTVVDDIGF